MPETMPILLDGSAGEGGGQILRVALALSAIGERPFVARRIRAQRIKPGLRPQHCEAIRAVARLCDAAVEGNEVGSDQISFSPTRPVVPGEYLFDIGTAGSAPLLFQTLCWPLALAGGPSQVTIRGGTHQINSPTFHDLALIWAPGVARLGFRVDLALQEAGFYPEGGGEMTSTIHPAHAMPPLDLRHRGTLVEVEVVAMVGGLAFGVAERLAERALRRLRELGIAAEATRVPVPARSSAGSSLLAVAIFEKTRAGFGALGDRGATPDRAADEAIGALAEFLRKGAAVDRYLADQLILPAALLAAGLVPSPAGIVPVTRYTVSNVTRHLLTNAEVVKRFLGVDVAVLGREGDEGEVRVQPQGTSVEVVPMGTEA